MGGKITPWGGGYYCGNGDLIRRFFSDGSLDDGFDMVGSWQQFSSLQGGDYHAFPDGRILFGGYHDINDAEHGADGVYNLAWFTNEGRLDTTRIHRTGNGVVWGIKEYPAGTAGGLGGKFLIHHWGTHYEGQPVNKLIRVHEDGSLDGSFSAPIPWGYLWAMEPLPDGRAYVGGTFLLENQTDTIQLIRVMPDGSLDPTFNNALDFERDPTHIGIGAAITELLQLGSGLLAIVGDFSAVDGHPRGGICIIDTTGAVVTHYLQGASCGNYDYQIGQGSFTYGAIEGITRAPSGDYYIWGAYHGYDDGTTNDTLQRMVTRLHGGEIGLGLMPAAPHGMDLRLYPNPANASLTVETGTLLPGAQLVLRDALGREVQRLRLNGHYTTLRTAHLHEGIYHLELLHHGERAAAQRVVVAH